MRSHRPSRRGVLSLLGGGALTLGAGWALTRDPAQAREAWSRAGLPADPRLAALSWAVLAPSPHNRQPWLVELQGEDALVLHCDAARLLPATDPHHRQIMIGLGAFLETLSIAAAESGLAAAITLFPEGASEGRPGARPVAHVRLAPGAERDPLFAQIARRRTVREAYEPRPVPPAAVAALTAAAPGVEVIADPSRAALLCGLAARAFERESSTPEAHAESVRLMRIGRAEIEAAPDGISLAGPAMEAMNLAGLVTRAALADPESTAFGQMLAMQREVFAATPAWLSLSGADGPEGAVQAGRAWMRVCLQATALDLDLQPASQALQEYPQMADLFAEAHAVLAPPAGGRVHMLARLGYGPDVRPSPRWPMETRLMPA